MALTKNRDVDHYIDQELRTFQVAAAKHIYKGAFLGLNSSGYVQPLTAGDPFVGIAYEEADNSAGASGAIKVRVYTLGDFDLTLTGAAIASLGRPVFASADDTLTFAAAGNSYVGTVQDVPATNEIILRIDPPRAKIKTVTHVVEDLAAGADIAARAIHHFGAAGWLVAARVVNQSTAAAGIDNSNTCVVAIATDAGTVVSTTFNVTTAFPTSNARFDMGALSNAQVRANYIMTLAVTNGATANPGPFLVEVDYV
ncbi:MAG: hypothetical protein HY287_05875 [Planctomycetes bacterium]|nr:hypothetical protein [Planctomycetota bacterium]MBI3833840.1 hypothetical protein [Planctomycetota bacterium]